MNRKPKLSKKETYEYIKRAQAGDDSAKEALILHNVGLVKSLALRFASQEVELEDLMQIGFLGLLKAADKFNPDYNVMFSTYAVPSILGEIKGFFRDTGRIKVSRAIKQDVKELGKVCDDFNKLNGREPKVSEMAELLGKSKEDICDLLAAREAINSNHSYEQDVIEQGELDECENQNDENLDKLILKDSIERLPEKQRAVIILRYYRDLTQGEVGNIIGISQVQVSRLEKQALENLKNCIHG